MNNNQTIEKLKRMRINGMAILHHEHIRDNRANSMTADEYLALLTDHEWENRWNRKIDRLTKQAKFKQKASLADVDYTHVRNLEKNMFVRLGALDFIKKKENIILSGPSGVGKSYLAQALGYQACQMGRKVYYFNTARLFRMLKLSKVDGTYLKEIKKLSTAELLILDDFGLQSFDNHARDALMDIIDDRHNERSTIISSQIPVSAWYDVIGEGTIADAILDRIVNSSHRINLRGESMRKGILKNNHENKINS